MSTSKQTIAVALALALAGAGVARVFAETPAAPAAAPAATQATERVAGSVNAQEEAQMSTQGLVAVRDTHLARMALNDGYTDHAKELLGHARELLSKVASENKPVTVTTEVKVGEKEVHTAKKTVTPRLIPILSELQVVEDFAPDGDKAAAVKQANEQMGKGDRAEAVETLRLAEVGLISLDVSMPLNQTISFVDASIKLIGEGKLHEANLELKKVGDALVKETSILVQPVAHNAAPGKDEAAKTAPAGGNSSAG